MNALVLYDTTYGNTKQIAHAIAEALGTVRVVSVADATRLNLGACDLLVVGGPTHTHGASEEMKDALAGVSRGSLRGVSVAAFDTRYDMSRWLTGSAAQHIARDLTRAGGELLAPPESFFVLRSVALAGEKRQHDQEHLAPGEVERARDWARGLLARFDAAQHLTRA